MFSHKSCDVEHYHYHVLVLYKKKTKQNKIEWHKFFNVVTRKDGLNLIEFIPIHFQNNPGKLIFNT